jgi:hypothetical protein
MKNLIREFIILISLILIKSQNSNGITIDISQEVLDGFHKQFLPIAIEELGKINITDTNIKVDAFLSNLYIDITNTTIYIQNLTSENIILTFQEPDTISIKSEGVHGRGYFKLLMKLGFIPYTQDNFIRIYKISVDADLKLTSQESSKDKGKMLPSAYISRISILLDFDFDIYGNSMLESAVFVAKPLIKEYINIQMQTRIRDIITEESKKFIAEKVRDQSVYVPLNYKNLVLDVSLLSPPAVIDRSLNLHINGTVSKLK